MKKGGGDGVKTSRKKRTGFIDGPEARASGMCGSDGLSSTVGNTVFST